MPSNQLTDQQIHDLYERVFRDTLVNGVFDTDDPNDPCVVEAVAEIRRVLAAPSIEAAAREIKHYDSPEDAATALIDEARRMRGGSPEDGACGQEQTIDQLKARCLNESLLATAYRKARDRIAELEREREQWEATWHDAADYDLCKSLLNGEPIAPPAGSVAQGLHHWIEGLRAGQTRDTQQITELVSLLHAAQQQAKAMRDAAQAVLACARSSPDFYKPTLGPEALIAVVLHKRQLLALDAALTQQDTPHRPIREVLDSLYKNGGDAWDGVALCEHGRHPEWCDTCGEDRQETPRRDMLKIVDWDGGAYVHLYPADCDADRNPSEVVARDVSRKWADRIVSSVNTQPCGHPRSAIVSSGEGTHYCSACVAEQNGGDDAK